ncbi:MAG: tetratricopeptide repeat protein [Thermoleophilia bacterium]|nr:tetratricopeptide repeat protein [Thermoleophilia bacterium]
MTLSVVLAPASADEVELIQGSTVKGPMVIGGRVRGQIQSETAAEVVVKLGANSTTIPTDQIASVRYDGQPPSFALAETREAAGQLAEAAELYKKAAGEAASRPLLAQSATFKQAEAIADLALSDPARQAEATTLLEAFLRANPNSRNAPTALEALARLKLQKGDYAGAEKTVADLAKLPRGGERSAVLRARILSKRGEHAKAVAELDAIIKAAPEGSARAREAKLARAESLAGEKKFAEAEAEARSVIAALPPEDAPGQSAAYNTLGDCLRAAGKPKDALLAFLHTDLLYAKDKEQHPRALAQIAKLWRELRQDDRAREAEDRLKKDYPRSPWASGRN